MVTEIIAEYAILEKTRSHFSTTTLNNLKTSTFNLIFLIHHFQQKQTLYFIII